MNENRNTRRKLDTDTGPDDENARSAVLLRFSCEQCHAGMSAWLHKVLDPSDYPQRVHCKRGTKSARIVLNTRAQCQDLVARFKDDGLPHSVSSPFFVSPRIQCLFVNLDHKNGKSYCDFSLNHSKKISLRRTPKALTLFQPLIAEHMWAHFCPCCAALEPVGQCFDRYSFECTTFDGLSHIIASLARESIAERETAVHGLPWTQTEKDNALAKCKLSLRARVSKKPMLCLHAVTDEEGCPLDD